MWVGFDRVMILGGVEVLRSGGIGANIWALVFGWAWIRIILDPAVVFSINQGTKSVDSENTRTFAANFSNIIPRAFL